MSARLKKVRFVLDATDWHGHGGETLWAAPIDDQPWHFRIVNSPFFARGISHYDVVEATPSDDNVTLEFARVVERAGHSTYMLIATADEAGAQSGASRPIL